MPSFEDLLTHCEKIATTLPPPLKTVLDRAEKTTKLPRAKIIAGSLVVVALYMVFGYFAAFICNFVGFVLPAYWSMTAIESSNKEDDTKWLTYWVVFAAFTCVDFFSDAIFTYFPFYWVAKVVFLAWCFAPIKENGSHKIYHKILRPYFLKNQGVIDKAMRQGTDVVNNLVKMD